MPPTSSRLTYLNTWLLTGDAVWGGCRTWRRQSLAEEHAHAVGGLREVTASPHFQFTLCGSVLHLNTYSLSFLLQPHIVIKDMLPLSLGTLFLES